MPDAPKVPETVRALARQLADPAPMRRGSFTERYVKCSKPGCPCGDRAEARHGPYLSLTRAVAGRTQSRWVAAEQGALVRRQVEAGQWFRRQVEAYWEACEGWADAQLAAGPGAASSVAAEKRGSRRASQRKSFGRSKRS